MASVGCLINGIIWFVLFVFLALPIGMFCAWLYIIFSVLDVLCSLSDLVKLFEKGMNLPRDWFKNAVNGSSIG